ncbi:allantoate amidohydrolase [Thiomicrorhabdus sp.]|uniref:allantoate amidohydrolase n=1 Tax=Thiomicrorhabdus sp. TaxID=2039724 RepID=UPI0029C758E9|nr:allantoate amidohydrolase [Thiomicrorhabdus sp.]
MTTRVIQRCRDLAAISDSDRSISRIYLSPAYLQGLQQTEEWMLQAGMETWIDAVGNVWGRYACKDPQAPTLILGSHLDTVPNAGMFDGILGVMVAIEAVDRLKEQAIELPFHIEVVGLGDEEGVRFDASMLGSRALIGKWEDELLELTDQNAKSLESALEACGLNPQDYASASRVNDNLLGFWEVHMEQGPVLEAEDIPISVVSAIAGARRFKVTIEGQAGHAGTVPMGLRQDALTAASEVVLMIEKTAQQNNNLLATVGHLKVFPSAVNVIPGWVEFTVDIRSDDDALRERVMNLIFHSSEAISMSRGVEIYWSEYHWAPAKQCAPRFRQIFEESIAQQKIHVRTLVSGAGHDAMTVAEITDIGMLFVRCRGGISHHPDEYVSAEDAEIAVNTLVLALEKLAESLQESGAESSKD